MNKLGYDKGDVAKDTGDSASKVSEAGHDFRDHSGAREGKDTDHFKSAPSWSEGHDKTDSGFSLFSKEKEYHSESDSGSSGSSK